MVSSKFILLTFLLVESLMHVRLYVAASEKYYAQSKLLNDLFLDYDKTSHPTPKLGYPVNVTLGIAVAQIVGVEEKIEGMNLNIWYRMKWKDSRLTWDPKKYKNITGMHIDSHYFWTPDIILYKPLTSEGAEMLGVTQGEDDLSWKIGVHSDGTVVFNFPGMIYGQCPLNIADYPFDQHNCSFTFSSWVHDKSEINLTLRSHAIDLDDYITSNEWHVISFGAKSLDKKYSCCPTPYALLVFHINVKRGASSYVSNYIIPSILIIILSFMMFTLPPEVGKRMEIGINLLLCLSVYLTILNTKMPTRSDVFPLLSKFYGCCIFILTCALLCTCWVIAYYFHDMSGWKIYTMPKFVQIVILHYLRRILRFSNQKKVKPSFDSVDSKKVIAVKPIEHSNDKNVKSNNESTVLRYVNKEKRSNKKGPNSENQNKGSSDKAQIDKNKRKDPLKVDEERISEKRNKEKKRPRRESNDVKETEKKKTVKPDKGESVQLGEIDKTDREQRNWDKKVKGTKNKVQPSTNDRTTKDKEVADNTTTDTTHERRRSRSKSKDSSQSETSYKGNRVYASKITKTSGKNPHNRKKSNEEIGLTNHGNDENGVVEKETKGKNLSDEFDGKKEEQHIVVRGSPSLERRKGKPQGTDTAGNDVDVFDKKSTPDSGFDDARLSKEANESIKWLGHLAENYVDNSQRIKNRQQWRQAAVTLNRLFLIILAISIVVIIIAVFLAR